MSKLLKIEGVDVPKESSRTAKVNGKYEEGLNKVMLDLKKIRERQEQARLNIENYREELVITGVDVAVVQDDLKRKQLLDSRETIREKIEEEELYLNLDVQAYKRRIIEEQKLDELRYDSGQEYKILHQDVTEYREELKKQVDHSTRVVNAMLENDNDYLRLLGLHKALTGEYYTRWASKKE